MDLITTGLVLCVLCAVLSDIISDHWDNYEHILVELVRNIIIYALVVLSIFFFIVAAVSIGAIIVGVYLDMEVAVPTGILSYMIL